MTDSQIQDLRIAVESDNEINEIRGLAAEHGLNAQEASPPSEDLAADLEPVTMVLIGGGVLAAAKLITGWIDKMRGGVVIDLREGATDDIHRDRDLPWGYVLIHPKDGGAVTIETKDEPKDAIERLLSEVISGAYKTVSDLAKVAKEAVGDDGKVSTKEPSGEGQNTPA